MDTGHITENYRGILKDFIKKDLPESWDGDEASDGSSINDGREAGEGSIESGRHGQVQLLLSVGRTEKTACP